MKTRLDTLRRAIRESTPIEAEYDDELRILCPHVLGKKAGRYQVLSYQVDGGSKSGLGPVGSGDNWRCMRVSGLWRVRLAPEVPWVSVTPDRTETSCVDEIELLHASFEV